METAQKTADRKATFSKMLTEGKVCAAQEESFLSEDMAKFAELATPIKLTESGTKVEPPVTPEIKSVEEAQDEVQKIAAVKLAEKKASDIGHAISLVLAERKDLREKIYG